MSNQSANPAHQHGGFLYRILRIAIDVRPEEVSALLWSCMLYFSVLFSYYVIRPIRDEAGVAGGVDNLAWLFTGTLIGMTLANPPFAALVSRMAPVRFISHTYRFFMLNLVVFLVLIRFTEGDANIWVGRIFFIWVAVFNLFVPSVFWALLVDVFSNDQSKRVFGFIAAGGTVGAIAGSTVTSLLVEAIGPSALMLVSVALLELGVFAVRRLSRIAGGLRDQGGASTAVLKERAVGGTTWSGIIHAAKSPYLLNISLYMLLFTILSTFLYFQQAEIAASSFAERGARTAFFANVDLAVNILTLGFQIFATGRLTKALGVAVTLTLLPLISVIGFLSLGFAPLLWTIVIVQVVRRAGNFAIARPTREILYTVVPREDKYKAKSFIDTFVYRAGDQVGAWSYSLMGFFGLGVAGVGFAAIPISVAWLVNGWWLGRRQEQLLLKAEKPAVSTATVDAGMASAKGD